MSKPIKINTIILLLILLVVRFTFAQTHLISGSVINGITSKPLSGITVTIKNIKETTITNFLGEYSLSIPDTMRIVEFGDFNEMELLEVKQINNNIFNIYLSEIDIYKLSLDDLMKIKVVSASKTEQKLVETSANVTVITSTDIELSGATSIPDLLRNVPGLDVMSGWASGIDVGGRGLNILENSKTLVLINGQRVNNDFTGAVKWMQIPILLNNIEQMENYYKKLEILVEEMKLYYNAK